MFSTKMAPQQVLVIEQEVKALLEEGAIEYVPRCSRETGFYSRYFIVPKKDGGLRPILDLQVLNDSVMLLKFKMLTLRQIVPHIRSEDWSVTIDLKDAYFHTSILPYHRKFLRFAFGAKHTNIGFFRSPSSPGPGSTTSHYPAVAGQVIVTRHYIPSRRASSLAPRQEGPSVPSRGLDISPPTRTVETVGLASEWAQLIDSGLSTEVVETILQSLPPPFQNADQERHNLLYPVRALDAYVHRAALWSKDEQLFVCFGPPNKGSPASKQRMSKWMVEVISLAYESAGQSSPMAVRSNSTRSKVASKALISGVALQEVCDAAGWSSPHTFVRFYSLDLDSTPGSQVLLS